MGAVPKGTAASLRRASASASTTEVGPAPARNDLTGMVLAPGQAAREAASLALRRLQQPAGPTPDGLSALPGQAARTWRPGAGARTTAEGTVIDTGAVPDGLLPAVVAHEQVHAAQFAAGAAGGPPAPPEALESEARAGAAALAAGRDHTPTLAAGAGEVLFWHPDDDSCSADLAAQTCEPGDATDAIDLSSGGTSGSTTTTAPTTTAPTTTAPTTTAPTIAAPTIAAPPVYGPQLPPVLLGPMYGPHPTSTFDPADVPVPEDEMCLLDPADAEPAPGETGTAGSTEADRTLIGKHAQALRRVYGAKAGYVDTIAASGPDIDRALDDFDTEIQQRIGSIRVLGVRLSAAEIGRRALTGESLTGLNPKLRVDPVNGPYTQGNPIRLVVDVEYVPRTDPVRVTWTGGLEGGNEHFDMLDRGGARDTELVLDSTFWFRAVPYVLPGRKNLKVTAALNVGPQRITPDLSTVLPIEPYRYDSEDLVRMSVEGAVMTGPATAKALVGTTLSFRLSQGPPGTQYMYNWAWYEKYTGMGKKFGRLHETSSETSNTFDEAGSFVVMARIVPMASDPWVAWPMDPGHALPTAALGLEIGTLQEWGNDALKQLQSEETPRPTVGELSARLTAEARENDLLAGRATDEDKKHYEELASQRRKMAAALDDRMGVPAGSVQGFPKADTEFGEGVYAAAVPASLVVANSDRTPGGGIQPLSLYLTMQRTAAGFKAVLIDATTKDMSPYEGEGATSRAAANAAIARWTDRNPYPIGGLAVYRYVLPDGTILRGRFSTTTREKEAEKWIEDILTVGGYVIAVLLLLAPEATVTKALALGLLGVGVGYGVHKISRNLELGIGAFDARNVLEAVGILGSALGLGGGALRQAGLRGVRPLLYRTGNWMVISAAAVDVGTVAYVTVESYEMLQATLSDPSLSDAQRASLLARTAGQMLAQTAMVVVGNRDLFAGGLKGSDFIGTRRPGLGGLPALDPVGGRPVVELDAGSRIDLQAELVRRGLTPNEVRGLTDTGLVAELQRVQSGAMRGPDVYGRSGTPLSAGQQAEVVRSARVAHDAPGTTSAASATDPASIVLTVDGVQVDTHVTFTAPAPGSGSHGTRSGPGRVKVDFNPRTNRWEAHVEIDPHLAPDDAALLLREELDEAGEIARKLNARVTDRANPLRGGELRKAVEGEQRAGLAKPTVIGERRETAHDTSAFRTLGRLHAEARRTGGVQAWARVDRMLLEMGIDPMRPDEAVRAAVQRSLGAGADPVLDYAWDNRAKAGIGKASKGPMFGPAQIDPARSLGAQLGLTPDRPPPPVKVLVPNDTLTPLGDPKNPGLYGVDQGEAFGLKDSGWRSYESAGVTQFGADLKRSYDTRDVVISQGYSGTGDNRRTTRQASTLDRVAVLPQFSPRKGTSGKVVFDAVAVVHGEGNNAAGLRIHDAQQDVVYVLEVTRRPYTEADRVRATEKQSQVLQHLDQLTQWQGAPDPAAYVYTIMTDVPMDAALSTYLEQVRATIQRAAPGKTVIVVHRRIGA